jgi:hypothetical protein
VNIYATKFTTSYLVQVGAAVVQIACVVLLLARRADALSRLQRTVGVTPLAVVVCLPITSTWLVIVMLKPMPVAMLLVLDLVLFRSCFASRCSCSYPWLDYSIAGSVSAHAAAAAAAAAACLLPALPSVSCCLAAHVHVHAAWRCHRKFTAAAAAGGAWRLPDADHCHRRFSNGHSREMAMRRSCCCIWSVRGKNISCESGDWIAAVICMHATDGSISAGTAS